jgi:dihydroorotase
MSVGPARIYGFDRPRIAAGAPANLVLLDLESGWRPEEASFRSKSANSWLLGQRLLGQVVRTIADGREVFSR